MRLDVYLTENNLSESRTRAKNLVELGRVTVNGKPANKVSYDVKEGDTVIVEKNYEASLGGIKLRVALNDISLSCDNKDCLDIGAANGGFCDVLLENGAKRVIALDVGECALPDRLKNDPRIIVMDRTNARSLTPTDLPYLPDIITVDVSFISLTQILPAVYNCLKPGGRAVCLIKPQFECRKKALSKKGIVTDKKAEQSAILKVEACATGLLFKIETVLPAPHPFEKKNQEYFIILYKNIA